MPPETSALYGVREDGKITELTVTKRTPKRIYFAAGLHSHHVDLETLERDGKVTLSGLAGLTEAIGGVICRTRAIADFEATGRVPEFALKALDNLAPKQLVELEDHGDPARDTWDPDICNCGRKTITAKGDLKATCPECRALPDYCDCEPPAAARPGGLAARILPGGIILDEPETPPAVWGDGESIIWAEGESLIIAGPDGVGKTTLAGQLIRGRLGIGDGLVLGMAVTPGKRNVLLLSMDRPRQARRALRRQFTRDDRDILDERLRIWQGPPPADLARNVLMLTELAALADADTIIIDSLKDAALKLADDETGSGWNRARQFAVEAGAELVELHHPRKAQGDNRKPSKLEDLYGSRWITAGAGSVISLWGEAGDPVVEFTHLKAPAAACPPFMMGIDQAAGTVHVDQPAVDLVDQIRLRGGNGMTAEVAARLMFGAEKPDRSQTEKARYKLNKKVADGVLFRRDGARGGGKDREPATWFLAASNQENARAEQSEKQSETNQTPAADRQSETGGDSSPLFSDCHEPDEASQ